MADTVERATAWSREVPESKTRVAASAHWIVVVSSFSALLKRSTSVACTSFSYSNVSLCVFSGL
jgi:hypothetical protein